MTRSIRRRIGAGNKDGGSLTWPALGNMGIVPDDVILTHILPRLDLTSRVRLAAVSKPWQALSRLVPLPADPPWLLGAGFSHSTTFLINLLYPSNHIPRLVSVSEIEYLVSNAAPGSSRIIQCVGSVDGKAILTSSASGIVLYNPFSREFSPVAPVNVENIYKVRIHLKFNLVVAMRDGGRRLSVCRFGDSDWVNLRSDGDMSLAVRDFVLHEGELYCISSRGNIFSFHLQDLLINPREAIRTSLIPPDFAFDHGYVSCYYHLVVSCGDFLVVVQPRLKNHQSMFLVYKMELNKLRVSVTRVKDLGETMLFLGQTSSVSCPLPPSPSNFFTKNCIYEIRRERSTVKHCYRIGKWEVSNAEKFNDSDLFTSLFPHPSFSSPHPSFSR